MATKDKKSHYRKCFLTDGDGNQISGGQTLQSALAKAIQSVQGPWQKSVALSNSTFHWLTETATHESCICGEIVFFETDRLLALIDIKDGKVWRGSTSPKDADGIDRKFQEQQMFFAIRENHVAVIQSTHLDFGVLVAFLSWLIQGQAKLMPGTFIDIRNMPSQEAREKLKDYDISAIKFGEPLYEKVAKEVPPAEGEPPRKRRKLLHEIKTNSFASDILGKLGVSQPIIDKIAKNRDPGAVQVDIQISYRSRSEKEASSMLQTVAQTLGTSPELNPEIILSNGSKITTSQLTLIGNLSIIHEGGRAGVDDALKHLAHWLVEQIQEKKV